MTHDDKKDTEHPLSRHWPALAPKMKEAIRLSVAKSLAQQYPPPADIPPELRELLARMEETDDKET